MEGLMRSAGRGIYPCSFKTVVDTQRVPCDDAIASLVPAGTAGEKHAGRET